MSEINLHFFRCFDSLSVEWTPGVNLIIGANAQGKTSILEAICCLLRLQSPRTSTLTDTVKLEHPAISLQGRFSDTHLRFDYPPRSIVLDGKPQSRAGDYLKTGLVTWFSNDDMALIRGGSSGRRRYLDFICAQLDPSYLPHLRAYDRALRSRNYLLKQTRSSRQEIEAWNAPLQESGEPLLEARAKVLMALAPYVRSDSESISGSTEEIQILYKPGVEGNFKEALAASVEEEKRTRSTMVGPHRDDFYISLFARDAASFASEGQQRTIALALKLAQVHVIHSQTKRMPILLIDDIFGELDPERRNRLMNVLPSSAQQFITTTHLTWMKPAASASIFELSHRTLKKGAA
ncbi:MAG: DNA replication and repair protein RecF [Chthoniobacterales bacterium]